VAIDPSQRPSPQARLWLALLSEFSSGWRTTPSSPLAIHLCHCRGVASDGPRSGRQRLGVRWSRPVCLRHLLWLRSCGGLWFAEHADRSAVDNSGSNITVQVHSAWPPRVTTPLAANVGTLIRRPAQSTPPVEAPELPAIYRPHLLRIRFPNAIELPQSQPQERDKRVHQLTLMI